MKGQLFVHMQDVGEGAINLRTGLVKAQLGPDHFLLEFAGANYRFSNVFSAQQLTRFVFFNTDTERQQFLTELQSREQPPAPQSNTPPDDGTGCPAE